MLPLKWLTVCGCVAKIRMKNFVVSLTNDDPAVTPPRYKGKMPYSQHQGALLAEETANLTLPKAEGQTYRYVVVQNQFENNQSICLAEVQVYARGM